jgi:ATP-dependent Zn protease
MKFALTWWGRLTEEIIYGEDIEHGHYWCLERYPASRQHCEAHGEGVGNMSDKVGRAALQEPSCGGPYMGLQMLQRQTMWGNKILGTVEEEVERLVNNRYLVAKQILNDNRDFWWNT